jgi:hypothetical protein
MMNGFQIIKLFIYNSINDYYYYNYLIDYTFNDADELTSVNESVWDTINLEWIDFSKSEYTYTDVSKTEIFSLWDTILNEWIWNMKSIYQFNDIGLVDTLVIENYDTVNDIWINNQRIISRFNEDFNEIETIVQFYDESNEWIHYQKDSVIYENDRVIEIMRMNWNSAEDEFELYTRNIYAYNYLGNLEEDKFQYWDKTDNYWHNYSKIVKYYSDIICTLDMELNETQSISCYQANDGEITLNINSGIEPYNINWEYTDSENLVVMDVEANKYYIVNVSDSVLCSITDSIKLEEPDSLFVELVELENANCYGSHDGSIVVSGIGGTGEYSYLWNDLESTANDSLINLTNGTYEVTVNDENNCQSTASFSIEEPTILVGSVIDSANISCFGLNDGIVEVAGNGGTEPYTYYWLELEVNNSFVNNLYANQYYYYFITDANGCEYQDSIMLIEPEKVITSEISGNTIVVQKTLEEYTVENTDGSTYEWLIDLGEVKYGQGTNVVLIEWNDTTGIAEIAVIEQNEIGCYGDTVKLSITVEEETSIDENRNSNIKVYPNPFSDKLNIISKNNEIQAIQLIDATGKIAFYRDNLNINSFSLESTGLKRGIYYLKLISDEVYMYKVILE